MLNSGILLDSVYKLFVRYLCVYRVMSYLYFSNIYYLEIFMKVILVKLSAFHLFIHFFY